MIDKTKDQFTEDVPTEGLHPDWVQRSGFDRRVKAVAVDVEQRSGNERRSGWREKLGQLAQRLIGGQGKKREGKQQQQAPAVAAPQPQMTAIIARPPKADPVPPTRAGAEELRPAIVMKPGRVPDKGVARDFFAGWAARSNAPYSLDEDPKGDQAAKPGREVAQAPSVTVRDINGKPVNGVLVTFAVAAGKGRIRKTAGVNDWGSVIRVKTTAQGVAAVGGWELGSQPETINTLVVSINSLSKKFGAKTTKKE